MDERTWYRLPTEPEWEYAALAGGTGALYGNLDAIAVYGKRLEYRLYEVGQKMPNPWGLYDMLGNAWELVEGVWWRMPGGLSLILNRHRNRW